MRRNEPKVYPILTVALPCDYCGKETTTVGIYLKAKAEGFMRPGFYSSCNIRLCCDCLREALLKGENDA